MTEIKLSPMQEELLKRADSIFMSISDAGKIALGVAKEQLPDIAYQYLAYGRAYTTFIVILSLAVFLLVLIVGYKMTSVRYRKSGDDIVFIPYAMGIAIVGFPALILFCNNISSFFMVWFAPKIWLITEVSKLVGR